MGRVLVTAKIENIQDVFKAFDGELPPAQIRSVTVNDALVDTGATGLCIPGKLIHQLGLRPTSRRRMRTTNGLVERTTYSAVRLTIQGYDCTIDVYEVPDHCPVLVGQIPLEAMDWVVDLKNQKLIDNPAHGGEHMVEAY
ncbi:MAG: aspartyl protease family protein [Gemmataceae bacterium]